MPRKSSKYGNKHAKGKRRGKGANSIQHAGSNPVYTPHLRVNYSPLPREFSVALKFTQFDKRNSNTQPSSFAFGLFEPLGNKPQFMNEMFAIYRYAKILAVSIRMEVVNVSGTPLLHALAPIPWGAATTTFDPQLLAERPRSVSKLVSASSGIGKSTISRKYFSFDELGVPVYDKQHYFDSAQASASTPQDQEAPAILGSIGAADQTSTWAALTTYTIVYHLQFFDLQWADYSLRDDGFSDDYTSVKQRPVEKRDNIRSRDTRK